MNAKIKVETHLHTEVSKDGKIRLKDIVRAIESGIIDKVIVTDHDETSNALFFAGKFPENIFPGEEVMTLSGELLLLFVKEKIPGGLSLSKTLEIAKEQGCFITIPHPFDRFRNSRIKDAIEEASQAADAIEIFNSRCLLASDNEKARIYALGKGFFFTAGSDAHVPSEIGTSGLLMPDFKDSVSFRESLKRAEVFGKLSPFLVHALSTCEKWRKKTRS
ncbi:PHP domain-containing protein [candidate division WOR-3 bacterium]|nr:PHP domain-containing protein [candidate division WOR-3 bacterium]